MSVHRDIHERQSVGYLLCHDDGLLDIVAGLGILFAGLFLAVQMPWLLAIVPTSLGPAWYGAKKALIAPRTTAPRAPAGSRRRASRLPMLLIVLGVLSMLLGIVAALGWSLDALPGWLRARPAALAAIGFGLPVVLALALAGAVLRIARYYAYAVLAVAVFAGSYLIGWAVWWSIVVVGTAVASGGVVSLILFLHRHPKASPQRWLGVAVRPP